MIKDELIIKFTPSDEDEKNVNEIKSFLEENNIPYTYSNEVYGMFTIKDIKGNFIEIRYVSSAHYPMDNSKRFGESHKGVPHDYFINISKKNLEENSTRTVWVYDHEWRQKADLIRTDGEIIKDYPRMKNVICNTILTATGHIHHRFYARDCEVKIVPNSELRPFLNENCFYGYRSANINLGLYLKKDKNGFKKGDLLFVYTFGNCYYGNKVKQEHPIIEIIRVATKIHCQVIGGSSKCLTYFLKNYPTIKMNNGKKEVKVEELRYYVDSIHLDGRSMTAMNFKMIGWEYGFKNVFLEDVDEVYVRPDGRSVAIKGKANSVGERKPLAHKRIMELIKDKKIISVAHAGTSVYVINREEYLKYLDDKKTLGQQNN